MSDILSPIESLPEVTFTDNLTLDDTLTEMINDFQNKYAELTGTTVTLGKADPNRLILNACAIQIFQGLQYIERAGKQDLLKYSYGAYLDNLGAWRGVIRNAAQPATVTVRFTLSEAMASAITIPEGTRVAAGNVYFETTEYNEITAGHTCIDILMQCTERGEIGNGLLPGEITTLVDPIGYVASVSNITASSGGCDIESDKLYAERIYLAPSSYSVAGPDDAYIYWSKTYSSDISDVYVTSPSACAISVYILQNGNLPDASLVAGLQEFFNDKKIKPQTDVVTVRAPDKADYAINLSYWINRKDAGKAAAIRTAIESAISDYIVWQKEQIGRDINPSELIKLIMAAGAKRVNIIAPVYTNITDTSVANLTTQTATYGGLE